MNEQVTQVEQPLQVSDASAFKANKQGRTIKLPSGLVVKVRKVELKTFLRQGQIPNSLLQIVQDALEKGKSEDAQKLLFAEGVDLEKVAEMYSLVDAVMQACFVQPQIHPLPTHDSEGVELTTEQAIEDAKDPNLVYTDEIDDEDKMFVFQFVQGGTDDVATFRAEAGASLAALAQSEGNGGATE